MGEWFCQVDGVFLTSIKLKYLNKGGSVQYAAQFGDRYSSISILASIKTFSFSIASYNASN
jgi:hypothetical protein